jgi:hypothetical protein
LSIMIIDTMSLPLVSNAACGSGKFCICWCIGQNCTCDFDDSGCTCECDPGTDMYCINDDPGTHPFP